jgi:hypothetical protein
MLSKVSQTPTIPTGEYEANNLKADAETNLRVTDVLRGKEQNFSQLLNYAKQSCNEDMVLFWVLAEAFATKEEDCDDVILRSMAQHIAKCYMRVGAVREINISANLRLQIIRQVDVGEGRLPLSLFRKAQEEVEQMMDKNLNGFLEKKRGFWKRQVAWEKSSSDDVKEKENSEHSEQTSESLDMSSSSMAEWASGGDKAVEKELMSGRMLSSVDELVLAIMSVAEKGESLV